MHALEPDPEQKTRGRRLLTGGVVAGTLATFLLLAAQNVVPVQRFVPEILQMSVVDDTTPPPLKELQPPPPPPPPPPKAKAKEEPKEKPVEQEEAKNDAPEPEASEAAAGLDASSFGSGSGAGMAFRTGTTQMGDPNKLIRKPLAITPPKPLSKAPKLMPARAVDPVLPEYPERARKLNIQGAVLVEVEVDEHGKLIKLRVRQGLEPSLDELALASVRRWRFQPASLGGRSVASTYLARIRFELD
jgi:periplasmic protein TonB